MSHLIACDVEGCDAVARCPDDELLPLGWRAVQWTVEERRGGDPGLEIAKAMMPGLAAALEATPAKLVEWSMHVCPEHEMPMSRRDVVSPSRVGGVAVPPEWVAEVLAEAEKSK